MVKNINDYLGVYVHIPFCKKICHYCDFCKILYNDKYISNYLDALEKEINLRYKGETVNSIYIGGGTPSSLDVDCVDRLLSILTTIKLTEDYEYTFECNYEDINIDLINILKSYGVNRISVGVETFDKKLGEMIGRHIDEELIFDNIALLKKYFDNINIDLIYGINSDIDTLKSDIIKFLELDIPHISTYSLIIEEHTKLFIDGHKYISEEVDNEMYEYIKKTLLNNGYIHYEISNYAKEGYMSKHNINYWHNGIYYGFGLGAVSYLDNYRISNTKNMSKYLTGNFQAKEEYEDINICKENDLILGLRLVEGIDTTKFDQKYHDDLLNKKIIKKLIKDGYLVISNGYLKCNNKYLYLQNTILEQVIGEDL